MENNLEILDNIMRPYFDKKAEVDNKPVALENEKTEMANKIREMKAERINRRRELEIELENVRVRHKIAVEDYKEKMEKEIEDYINSTISSNPTLTATYGAFIRKDLERGYNDNGQIRMGYDQRLKELDDNFKDQEEALLNEIAALKSVSEDEKNEKQSLEDMDKRSDYTRVDLRELVELKDEARKKLFAERKRLNQRLEELKPQYDEYNKTVEELKEYQIKLNEIVEKLSNFKYEYNAQNQVVNSEEWKKLYEERVLISDKITDLTNILVEKTSIIHEMNDVNKSIEKVEEYIKLTELTKEEGAAVMMSMTPWERDEYNRRKNKSTNEDLIEINDSDVPEYEVEDDKVVVDNMENLVKTIYHDVVKTISNLRTIKLNGSKGKLGQNEYYLSAKSEDKQYEEKGTIKMDESVKLPCGEYVSKEDIVEATERLYAKPKAITYIVKETGKAYKMSKDAVQKLKETLKNRTTISLVRENKMSKLDLLKVFGKKKANEVMEEAQIGELRDSNLEEGEFVNKNETIVAFKNLFTEKKVEWLRNLSNSLKEKADKLVESLDKKQEDNFYVLDLDEEFHIKQK